MRRPDRPDAEQFAELALTLHGVTGFEDTVERVLEFAVKALDCACAGILLMHDGARVETIAATDPVVEELDRFQLACGQGPDLELIADRHGVLIEDATLEERWPRWVSELERRGLRSMLGARLYTTRHTIGSINFYDPEPRRFGPEDVDVAHMLARHAAVAMENARGAEHLMRAVDARNLVGQAQGILMERFGLDAEQAFGVLRRYSQDNNVKLHVVAERLVATRRLPE